MRRIAALAFGLLIAGLLLLAAESRCRRNEDAIDYLWDEPGRKHATQPGHYGANSGGFHERELNRDDRPARRIVVLGDSATWGGGLALTETWTRQAEAQLPGSQLVNFAQYGYDMEQIAATWVHRARAWDPDLVVVASFPNDATRSRVIYVGDDRAPVWIDTAGGLVPRWMRRSSALVRRLEGLALVDTVDARADLEFYRDHLNAFLRALDGTPVLMFGLVPHVLANPDLSACPPFVDAPGACAGELERARAMASIAVASGIPSGSVVPYLREEGAPAYFPDGDPTDWRHANAAGHTVFARAFVDILGRHDRREALPGIDDSDLFVPTPAAAPTTPG